MNRDAVLREAMPPARRFAPGLLLGLLSSLCAVALLATSSFLIVRAAEQPPILYLSMAVVGVRAFALGRAAFRYVERLSSHDAAFRRLADMRARVYERLVPIAPDGLGRLARGDLVSRMVGDIDTLQDLPLRVVQPVVISVAVAALSVVGVFLLSPIAGGALLVCLVLAFVVGTSLSTIVASRADRALSPLRGALSERLFDVISNLDVLVAFGAIDERLASIRQAEGELRKASIARSAGVGLTGAAVSLAAGLATAAALAAGLLCGDGISGPAFGVIALVPMAVFEVFAVVPQALSSMRGVRASADRIASLDAAADSPRLATDAGVRDGAVLSGAPRIELSGLSAAWPDGPADAGLGPIDLVVEAGDRVLIRGESGAGKTTLAHVLVRFLSYEGSYRIGGVEASTVPQAAVRSWVGLCEQIPYLFDESVRQNLLFARETASDDELLDVLARVGLADWVAARGGLDARVGERGALVSGGQAQRMGVARALLADFPVLVVDEPTASVDAQRADALVRDILTAAEGRTVILISHLPVPDGLVSRTLRLDAGRIVEDVRA